ncbi:MAG: DNA primase [Acidobacteria bacterium]|nr:DNA primase [Acidobacteriota bacterium]MCI0567451.1 DNA primase [Acidobacteriota bacterium]
MPSRTDEDFLEKVRASLDIREIVAGYLPLKKVGSRYRGLCPFHTEKTPSFHVDAGKQLFYCFGCGTGGDAFKFLMLYEKVDFPEALRLLARRYGIPLPERVHHASSERQALLRVQQAAVAYFRKVLLETGEGKAGREYLKRRGLKTETEEAFSIGFAPDRWDGLKAALLGQGFPETQLLNAGLLLKKEETGRTFDRFRSRLIFPIRNLSGECVGFGGRIVAAGEPKYLNSPETPLFRKGEVLYGLDGTAGAIRKLDRAILVEGYMDFLSLHQTGVEGLAATLGTGFTPSHARLLARFTRRVVVNFDPDSAGQAATRRSLDILLESGFEVRVLQLPGGKDPDKFVREEGPKRYRDLLENAPTYLEYLARESAEHVDLASPAGKIQALNLVLPYVARLESAVERSEQVKLLSEVFRIQDGIVLQELKSAVAARRTNLRSVSFSGPADTLRGPAARLLKLFIELPEARQALGPSLGDEDLAGSEVERIWRVAKDMAGEGEMSYGRLGSRLSNPTDQDLLLRLASMPGPVANLCEAEDCVRRLREGRLARRLQELQEKLETAADGASVDDLLRQKMDLRREIHALRSAPAS